MTLPLAAYAVAILASAAHSVSSSSSSSFWAAMKMAQRRHVVEGEMVVRMTPLTTTTMILGHCCICPPVERSVTALVDSTVSNVATMTAIWGLRAGARSSKETREDDDDDDHEETEDNEDCDEEEVEVEESNRPIHEKDLDMVTATSAVMSYRDVLIRDYKLRMNNDNDDDASASNTKTTRKTTNILGGSFVAALNTAYQQARMLVVVLIPPPDSHRQADAATVAMVSSIVSRAVSKVSEQPGRRRRKGSGRQSATAPDNGNMASYQIWCAPRGSLEAKLALSRIPGVIGTTTKDQAMLLVVCPVVPRNRSPPVVVPRLLQQQPVQRSSGTSSHSGNRSASSQQLAQWLIAVRKRHVKDYAKLQRHVQEQQWHTERTRNYQASVASDETKRVQQHEADERTRQSEQKQREHTERIQHRRVELLQALVDEPVVTVVVDDDDDDNQSTAARPITTVALRLVATGQTCQRRFDSQKTKLVDIFNWIDATLGLEREQIMLQTMNGRDTFDWDTAHNEETTLDELKWGKMIALRVRVATEATTAVTTKRETVSDTKKEL